MHTHISCIKDIISLWFPTKPNAENRGIDTFYVMDSFPLPVEGTETRVNAGNEANEFMCSH